MSSSTSSSSSYPHEVHDDRGSEKLRLLPELCDHESDCGSGLGDGVGRTRLGIRGAIDLGAVFC
jgi:hypothetical protein